VTIENRPPLAVPAEPGVPPSPGGSVVAQARAMLSRQGVGTRGFMVSLLVAGGIWAAAGGPFINLVGQACVVYAIAALGQAVLISSAGQVALSGGAFMAIGAFATGMLANTPVHAFPVTALVCAVVGWIVGLIFGLPGLRFRGLYLLLASLALQFIVLSAAQNYESAYHPAGLTIPVLKLGSLNLSSGRALYVTFLIILGIIAGLIWAVERTGVGLAWRALRESEVAAAISGVDVVRWKLYAFAASGAITAVAGCLFAYMIGRADYNSFDLTLSISLITMIYIGGVRSRLGVLIGAVVISALPYILQDDLNTWLGNIGLSAGWYTNNESEVNAGLFSLLFLLVVLFEPRGIEGLLLKGEHLIRRALGRHGGLKADDLEAPA
jgi:branched-chain amino acid transport system permease protein